MPNSIALAQKYLPILDEIYKRESITSILDAANNRVQFVNANTVKLFKTSLQGLGNYARNSGFVDGDVTATWETHALSKDRGRSFSVDAMDDEETINMAFGTLAGEFLRTKVVPEIDAYRFAKYASTSGISTATATDIVVGTTDCLGMLEEAEEKMGDDEVPAEGRILFVSELFYRGLKGAITRVLVNENGVQRNIEVFNGMRVIRVPKARFNTAVTLYDGSTSGQEAGGYIVPASTSYAINFMIIHPSAVLQVAKHVKPRIFAPDTNQKADAWKFDYRIYHDAFVEDNKVKGIYLSKASTANS